MSNSSGWLGSEDFEGEPVKIKGIVTCPSEAACALVKQQWREWYLDHECPTMVYVVSPLGETYSVHVGVSFYSFATHKLTLAPALVICTTCLQQKHPWGRDTMNMSYCGRDCSGYTKEPHPGPYWPGEEMEG